MTGKIKKTHTITNYNMKYSCKHTQKDDSCVMQSSANQILTILLTDSISGYNNEIRANWLIYLCKPVRGIYGKTFVSTQNKRRLNS